MRAIIPPVEGGFEVDGVGIYWKNALGEVTIEISCSTNKPVSNMPAGTIIGTLPEGFRPNDELQDACVLRSKSHGLEHGIIFVSYDGNIRVCRSLESQNNALDLIFGTLTFAAR